MAIRSATTEPPRQRALLTFVCSFTGQRARFRKLLSGGFASLSSVCTLADKRGNQSPEVVYCDGQNKTDGK